MEKSCDNCEYFCQTHDGIVPCSQWQDIRKLRKVALIIQSEKQKIIERLEELKSSRVNLYQHGFNDAINKAVKELKGEIK